MDLIGPIYPVSDNNNGGGLSVAENRDGTCSRWVAGELSDRGDRHDEGGLQDCGHQANLHNTVRSQMQRTVWANERSLEEYAEEDVPIAF